MPPGWHITTGSVFLGGRNLGPTESATYVSFVARRDGQGAILRRNGASAIMDWKANDAILPHPGKDTVKNVLRVDVAATEVTFSANGKEVMKLPREGLTLDGQFGFRIGKGMNVHASRLDITHRLAPVRLHGSLLLAPFTLSSRRSRSAVAFSVSRRRSSSATAA